VRYKFRAASMCFLFLVGRLCWAQGWFEAGRTLSDTEDAGLRVTAGTVTDIKGLVQETRRQYYDVTGQPEKQALAENWDLEDFGMDDTYPAIGLSMEKAWTYFSLQWDVLVMNPDVDSVAQRNYYIGVGEDIEYQGQSYDNLMIPEGTAFSAELLGGMTELRWLITPFTCRPVEGLRVTPWIDLGLLGFLGHYQIDAGSPEGVTQYMSPPEDFVIKGSSEGIVGLAVPEIGLGGEIRIGHTDRVSLVLQGHYAVCNYDGSTKYVVSTGHREKDVDIDHVNIRLRCLLEVPLESGRRLTLGAQYQSVDSEVMVTAGADTPEEIVAQKERFDKWVEFELTALTGVLGLTF